MITNEDLRRHIAREELPPDDLGQVVDLGAELRACQITDAEVDRAWASMWKCGWTTWQRLEEEMSQAQAAEEAAEDQDCDAWEEVLGTDAERDAMPVRS